MDSKAYSDGVVQTAGGIVASQHPSFVPNDSGLLCIVIVALSSVVQRKLLGDKTEKTDQQTSFAQYLGMSVQGMSCSAILIYACGMTVLRCGLLEWSRRRIFNGIFFIVAFSSFAIEATRSTRQFLSLTQDLLMATVADKCVVQGVTSVRLFGFKLACQDSEAYAYSAAYVKSLPYQVALGVIPLVWAFLVVFFNVVHLRRSARGAV